MRKLVCIGWCDADDVINYGQILQGISMMMILRKLFIGKIIFVSYLPRNFKAKLFYVKGHVNVNNGHLKSYIRTKRIINQIEKDNNVTLIQVSSIRKLNRICVDADYLICGSDQIWHPQNYDAGYFLNCGNKNAIRISYAASLPKTNIEPQFKNEYSMISNNIKKIDYISIREEKSCEFLTKISGKNTVSVLDPTYLINLNTWELMDEEIHTPDNYLFVYTPNGMDSQFAELVYELSNQLKIDNILVMITRGKNMIIGSKGLKYVTLGQFLHLIRNASCVVTSSFHAVVFSTIFNRSFWCYDVPNPSRGEDIRLKDLLDKFNLKERRIGETKSINYKHIIDYDLVNKMIDKLVKRSFDFLEQAIS